MTKRLPQTARGEVLARLHVKMPASAFQPPVLDRTVEICDWREGIDLGDVEFRGNFITEEEAGIIRQRRLAKMREILEEQGWTVTAECVHGDACLVHPGGIGCDD